MPEDTKVARVATRFAQLPRDCLATILSYLDTPGVWVALQSQCKQLYEDMHDRETEWGMDNAVFVLKQETIYRHLSMLFTDKPKHVRNIIVKRLENDKVPPEFFDELLFVLCWVTGVRKMAIVGSVAGTGKRLAEALSLPTCTVEGLHAAKCGVDREWTISVTNALKSNTSVTKLGLGGNHLDNESVILIAEMLEVNEDIYQLDLYDSHIGYSGAVAIARALAVNRSFEGLDLSGCGIDSDGATAIAESLVLNSTLTLLLMCGCNIGDTGAVAFAKMLKVNKTIVGLHLGGCNIEYSGASAIAESLKSNITLVAVMMNNCNIGDNGAMAFAEMLKANKALRVLDMGGCNIGDSGCVAIAESLKTNSTLNTLELGRNMGGTRTMRAFAESAVINTGMHGSTLGILDLPSEGRTEQEELEYHERRELLSVIDVAQRRNLALASAIRNKR